MQYGVLRTPQRVNASRVAVVSKSRGQEAFSLLTPASSLVKLTPHSYVVVVVLCRGFATCTEQLGRVGGG
jgi:hypothetical protein